MQVDTNDADTIKQILQTHLPNAKYWLFGSRIKGTAKPFSDLDIAIISSQPIPLETLSTLEEAFANSDLPYKIDLVDFQRISTEFQSLIKNNHVELSII